VKSISKQGKTIKRPTNLKKKQKKNKTKQNKTKQNQTQIENHKQRDRGALIPEKLAWYGVFQFPSKTVRKANLQKCLGNGREG